MDKKPKKSPAKSLAIKTIKIHRLSPQELRAIVGGLARVTPKR